MTNGSNEQITTQRAKSTVIIIQLTLMPFEPHKKKLSHIQNTLYRGDKEEESESVLFHIKHYYIYYILF